MLIHTLKEEEAEVELLWMLLMIASALLKALAATFKAPVTKVSGKM